MAWREFSADWGPHICPSCYGAGWMRYDVPVGDPNFGRVIACGTCGQADQRALKRAWELSTLLDPNAPNPPSFKTFVSHDAASAAMFQAAMRFASEPRGWLTIHGAGTGRMERGSGRWGAGKSHLGEAIARTLLNRKVPTLYLNATQLYEYLGAVRRDDGDDTDYSGRLRYVQEVPVLIVDEVNRENDTAGVNKVRLALFDQRYRQATQGSGGATVLLSNDDPAAWLDPALASRAYDARFVQIKATPVDYRRLTKEAA